MNYFNGQHYASLKSICDWLQVSVDRNGNYKEVYEQWGEMSTEEQVIELELLESILNMFIEEEEDKMWLASFNSALETVMKIQEELVGGM